MPDASPAPWYLGGSLITAKDNTPIAIVLHQSTGPHRDEDPRAPYWEDADHNGRLLAAAPDMRAALEACRAAMLAHRFHAPDHARRIADGGTCSHCPDLPVELVDATLRNAVRGILAPSPLAPVEERAFTLGWRAGYRVACNRALFATDEKRGTDKPHGAAYDRVSAALSADDRFALKNSIDAGGMPRTGWAEDGARARRLAEHASHHARRGE